MVNITCLVINFQILIKCNLVDIKLITQSFFLYFDNICDLCVFEIKVRALYKTEYW